jgi:sulfate adenylyltransferase subunit 2
MTNIHLNYLEDEAIYIIREAAAEFERPIMLYSVGKDSSVLMRLLIKAFYPAKPPIKLMHINTGWKFKEMIQFRDQQIKKFGLELIEKTNQRGKNEGIIPFGKTAKVYTDVMKTETLRNSLSEYSCDVAIGGARRDEEKSRAKERIFSFRNQFHGWNPKDQRPEMFNLFNCKIGKEESMRCFPISNWTEMDVWQYIKQEEIEVVPLYFAKKRPIVERDGALIMVDDERLLLQKDEKPKMMQVRFRTLGCYPLTGAIESEAKTLDDIIKEMEQSKMSERQGRLIDKDQSASMEKKKLEGYF